MKEILKKAVIAILTWEAKLILKKYKPKIVAITGSVGKTSAKDAAAEVLSSSFRVRKSQKSYNSELGVPLTIIGASSGWDSMFSWFEIILKGLRLIFLKNEYPEILILEVGADRPGDIKRIRSFIKPDVAIVTTLQKTPVHVEFFSGPEEVFEEKSELIKNLGAKAAVFLNADDEEVMKIKGATEARVITFGLSRKADVQGSGYKIFLRRNGKKSVPEGIQFEAKYGSEKYPVKIFGTFGKHQIYSALAGIAAGIAFKINLENAIESLSRYSSPPGRLKLIAGLKGSWILDDSYNSSPKALLAAFEVLKSIKASRKIAVLGDMTELGRFTIPAHREIGETLPKFADLLYTVGIRAKFFAEAAIASGFPKENVFYFYDSDEAGRELEKILKSGDLILVKGSQSMRMEKVVEQIMSEPEKKAELLVRQESEWTKK